MSETSQQYWQRHVVAQRESGLNIKAYARQESLSVHMRVLRHERVRYACPDKTTAPQTAPMPPQILPRSNASPNLLAMLLTVKSVDGLPAPTPVRSFMALPKRQRPTASSPICGLPGCSSACPWQGPLRIMRH